MKNLKYKSSLGGLMLRFIGAVAIAALICYVLLHFAGVWWLHKVFQ